MLTKLSAPALFWLDGHYSGGATARAELDTPVIAELRAILGHPVKGHVLLIDDAREFVGANGYPTLAAVEEMIRAADPGASYDVRDDIIRVVMSG